MTCRLSFTPTLSLASLILLGVTGCIDPSETETSLETETSDATTGETGETGGTEIPEPDPAVEWPSLACDPLVPDHCAYPYPNNVYSIEAPETETGRRLNFDPSTVPAGVDYQPSPEVWHQSDGFSPASTMLAYLPGATIQGLPTPLTIADSLADGAPTVILDAETGERIPHWAELDMSHGNDERRTFMIRPAVRLEPDARYIVAIREVVDGAGVPLEPSPAFAALRDLTNTDDLDQESAASVEARRPLYADIFARLGEAGVERESLQLAWDFTTASDTNITGRLVQMRDVGLDMLGPEPMWTVTDIELDPEPGLAARVTGSMTVPLFLDSPTPGGRMTLGPDGLPEALTTAEYPFLVLIPASAYDEPAGLMQFGHGLFGSYTDVDDGLTRELAIDHNLIVFATTWTGLSGEDLGHLISLLQTARLDEFDTVVDRLAQGVFNSLALMRLMRTNFADAPELLSMPGMEAPQIDGDQAYFFGGSLGGIMGSVYMALTTEVDRGALAVPGQPFSLLLNRSEAFEPLATLSQIAYEDTLDLRFSLELMQQLWDRAEPSGYSRHIGLKPLPGTDSHEVIMLDALGDHLVPTLGAHIMAREIGIPQLNPVREIFGVPVVDEPYEDAVLIEYDFGLPPEPITNVPMTEGSDPHGALANVPNALQTVEQFLRTGVVESFCDGVCDPS